MTEPSAGHVDAAVVTVYQDAASEWRWSASDTNGRKVADSGEGYVKFTAAFKAASDLFPNAKVIDGSRGPSLEDAQATKGTGSSL